MLHDFDTNGAMEHALYTHTYLHRLIYFCDGRPGTVRGNTKPTIIHE